MKLQNAIPAILMTLLVGCSSSDNDSEMEQPEASAPVTQNFPPSEIVGAKDGTPPLSGAEQTGYASVYNASIEVLSVDAISGEIDAEAFELLALGLWEEYSSSTYAFFDPAGQNMYLHFPSFSTIRSIFGNYLTFQWETRYSYDNGVLAFTAISSSGSYNDCPWESATVRIVFEGTLDDSGKTIQGYYELAQEGPEAGCAFACSGAMVVNLM